MDIVYNYILNLIVILTIIYKFLINFEQTRDIDVNRDLKRIFLF